LVWRQAETLVHMRLVMHMTGGALNILTLIIIFFFSITTGQLYIYCTVELQYFPKKTRNRCAIRTDLIESGRQIPYRYRKEKNHS
jgi:hypothetical protein